MKNIHEKLNNTLPESAVFVVSAIDSSKNGVFLTLKRSCTTGEFKRDLLYLKPILESNKLEGFAFLDTPEQFRVTSDERDHLFEHESQRGANGDF